MPPAQGLGGPSSGEDIEVVLCNAVKYVRDNSAEELTTAAVFNALQQEPAFKGVTIAQVRKAERMVKQREDEAENDVGAEEEEEEDIDNDEEPETVAENCRVSGDGLREATVRQPSYFWIEAFDFKLRRRQTGGDKFLVAIRGMSQTRARVTDNNDGTYLVVWKPHVSGFYDIAISHNGTALPGTPFTCNAQPTMPCPANCIVRGEHLTSAVSRATHYFEVLFKDRLNHVAHAIDLDVYVEQVPPTSPRNRHAPQTEQELARIKAEEEAAAAEVEKSKKKKDKNKDKGGKGGKGGMHEPPPLVMATAPAPAPDGLGKGRIQDEDAGKSDVLTRYRMMRVRIGQKPLIVRAEYEMDSEQIGNLLPGQIVTILEERTAEGGQVRACVALDSVALSCDGAVATKRKPIKDAADLLPIAPLSAPADPQAMRAAARAQLAILKKTSSRHVPIVKVEKASTSASPLPSPTPTGGEPSPSAEAPCGEQADSSAAAAVGASLDEVVDAKDLAASAPADAPTVDAVPTATQAVATPSTASAPPSLLDRLRKSSSEAAADMAGAGGGLYGQSRGGSAGNASAGNASGTAAAPMAADGDAEKKGLVGWVTLVKEGKKLVTSRVKLDPGARRQYLQQWARRKANDRAAGTKGGVAVNELKADPMGIGFGFGGVEPGTLHAHGQLHEVHKVSYSIGLAGQYLLHVRLRQQAMAMPGSPFRLTVTPAGAYAKSTRLPEGAIKGMVGTGSDAGCSQELRTADKMGNLCIVGGANVKTYADHDGIETEVVDRGDGTYVCHWKSKYSGTFKTRVTIDGEDVIGSPTFFSLSSSTPELSKSDLYGDGLKHAIAGALSTINIKFVDQFSNTALPGADFKFGMSIGKEKDKLSNAKPHDFDGQWEDGDTGVFTITYKPMQAGSCEMHVWCDPKGQGERVPFPGSPFHVSVAPGAASAIVSLVDGYQKVQKEEKNDKYAKQSNHDPNSLYASDTVVIKPQIFDEFSNATTLAEGALVVVHKLPNGSHNDLGYTTTQKGGLTSYEIRHDTAMAGHHEVDIVLDGDSVKGAPVTFVVEPDKPDPQFCKLSAPDDPIMYNNTSYTCKLKTFDKFNNECRVGGLSLSTRLQLMKQGVHDQTALVPSNHSCTWEDNGNGSYSVHMTLNILCTVKLFINMDKNLPAAGGELPPVQLQFIKNPNEGDPDEAKGGGGGNSPNPAVAKGGFKGKAEKLKAAANEVMAGFGMVDERRDKDALLVAAEAFADNSDTFMFDKATSSVKKTTPGRGAKGSGRGAFDSKATSSGSSQGLGTPNPNLFDKTSADSSGSRKSAKSSKR